MNPTYNFSAGPAVLPKPVLKQVQEEMMSYKGSNMSVMELSHRSSLFQSILEDAEQLLRDLMNIPSNYKVLFLQGGASLQFSMIPLNLGKQKVAYVNSGSFSKKAIAEAKKYKELEVSVIASSESERYVRIPEIPLVDQQSDYLHITTNNTIVGTAFYQLPKTGKVPLVADMSSNILSNQYDVSDFGLIYAGAQKNIGPSGLTVVIVREDLLKQTEDRPSMLDYKLLADNGSLYNTPPTFGIYVAKLVFEWLKGLGGVPEIVKQNQEKAQLLYKAIDQSPLFSCPVKKEFRSINNVTFVSGSREVDTKFVKMAEAAGFLNLKGHRSVGGMRASLYNAFPKEGVEALVAFMQEFEKTEGRNQ